MHHLSSSFGLSLVVLALLASTSGAEEPADLHWEADIRPILKTHCFQCHGEAGEKKSGLDLRLRRLAVSGGDSGPAIVPGKPDESLVLERVSSGEMPPGDKRLTDDELARIRDWIAAGAKTARAEPDSIEDGPLFTDEERNWWSFRKLARPDIPDVARPELVQNPIDAFLLSRLESAPVSAEFEPQFAERASRSVLIRRASFILLGLPAAPNETRAFEQDNRPGAWQALVDRLLASPHYGERWGRHWLDVAGYADSEGYTDEDRVRPHAFRYRDYVIRAFNDNKPFDQFIIEQLAGDELLLPPYRELSADAIEKLAATGFLRMAPDGTASGGIDQNVARNQVVADTLQIVGTSLLGLTVNCAQCHDHRYDPIPQVDYYRMRAIFEPALNWKQWKAPPARQISLYTQADRDQKSQVEAEAKQVDDEHNRLREQYIAKTLEHELLMLPVDRRDALRTAYRTETAKRSEAQKNLLDEYPNIKTLSPGSLYLFDRKRSQRANALDARRKELASEFVAAVRKETIGNAPADQREALTAAAETLADKRSPEQLQLLVSHPGATVDAETLPKFNPEAAAVLAKYKSAAEQVRNTKMMDNLKVLSDKAAEIRKRIPVEHFVRALTETPGAIPTTVLFYRGDHNQPKETLTPASLSVLNETADIPANDEARPTSGRRLAFARHLTSGRHPLVARVLVNRIWMHHFGRGLVNSPGDFGVLGEKPTHPQLLDWLAVEFVESGWDVKHLHRLILTSAAYQQSSVADPSLVRIDPENRLYGRMSLRRLDSDAMRDAVLVVSGRFNPKLYGEPVPVMEDAVGQIILGVESLDGERKPKSAIPLNGEEFRRSLYVQARRTRPLAVLETFDAPAMTPNCDRRASSNVAPQSLLLMNSDFALEYADHFADRLQAEAGEGIRDQITLGWQLAFGRTPQVEQVSIGEQFIAQQKRIFAAEPQADTSPSPESRALASFCQGLLSASPFLYVE